MGNEPKDKIKQFFTQFHAKAYRKGEMVLQPEQNPSGVIYLSSGFIREYAVSKNGTEVTIHIFAPRSYFPMMWVVADLPNRYYYEAFTDAEVYMAPKHEVLAFIKTNQDVLFDIARRVLIGLDKITDRLEHLAYSKAQARVVSILLYLARHFGVEKNGNTIIQQKFTHQEMGALAGLTRETTSREWEKLEKAGLIRYEGSTIVITDIVQLNHFLNI